jgi:hypothetical protein
MTCSFGFNTTHPTSLGMRSGWIAHAATKNLERSSLFTDTDANSKLRQETPKMVRMHSGDHTWAGVFSSASNTL